MANSVYKIIELVGTSETSWEAAAKNATEIQGGAGNKDHELYNLSSTGKACYRCGNKGHVPDKCYFKT